jgi:YgiT-type zinc finger domain-containing protein
MNLCFECGSQVAEETTELERTWNGRIYFISHVPMMVCTKCGECYVDRPVLKRIEELLNAEAGSIAGNRLTYRSR